MAPAPDSPRRALVFGATGLVGGALVPALLDEGRVAAVIAPVRRAGADFGDARVRAPVVEFGRLRETLGPLAVDQVFLCLGTTMRKAGSKEAFRRVDFDAVVEAATAARASGVEAAFLVSSIGASEGAGGFYLRVKGEAERAVADLGFPTLHVFRPSVLVGERSESRPAERVAIVVGQVLAPLMVGPARRYRPVEAAVVARAMARASRSPGSGLVVHESDEIAREGR